MSPHSEVSLIDSHGNNGSGIGHNIGPQREEDSPYRGSGEVSNGNGSSGNWPAARPRCAPDSVYLPPSPPASGCGYDLICVGFGPASLAIAVAMHDALAAGTRLLPDGSPPKVLFIEKQAQFAWHTSMLLPGAKMQISFIKDLATLRDPRSEFTFLNFLHRQGRLVDFTNLGTFLPTRAEYEDYLRWCAAHFDRLVRFGHEVYSVSPNDAWDSQPVRSFSVLARDIITGITHYYQGRNVLLATGGQPSLPKCFPLKYPRVIHSFEYAHRVRQILPKLDSPCRVAVVGAGQSAAEIFRSLQNVYHNSKTWLVMRPEFLRPSDDSPFVNSVFNTEYVDDHFPRSAEHRNNLLTEARATNYGVVRLSLIEEFFERMYDQKRKMGDNERQWPHRILGGRQISSVESRCDAVALKVQHVSDSGLNEETIEADLVIAATGYHRDAHIKMLRDAWGMLPQSSPSGLELGPDISGWKVETDEGERKLAVGRDYRVNFAPGAVAEDSGIWLQGCCEGTHGRLATFDTGDEVGGDCRVYIRTWVKKASRVKKPRSPAGSTGSMEKFSGPGRRTVSVLSRVDEPSRDWKHVESAASDSEDSDAKTSRKTGCCASYRP